ncbi:MAG: hypothetical protein HY924_17395 [Elusimicrobia bacterium]|nr:hypothetical protein [Elusimicrobiota bacterium]
MASTHISDHQRRTRRIYHAQHERIVADGEAFSRIRRMYDKKTLGLPETWFKGKDVRKFFAPLHYDRDSKLSKILYGEGYVQYVGRKR